MKETNRFFSAVSASVRCMLFGHQHVAAAGSLSGIVERRFRFLALAIASWLKLGPAALCRHRKI
ncbi:hypothetical protein AJ87_21450 [Rhizobium yanglingense]|nr:hypothetical protein AJ87_21450 [Rhizobium yanglingense]